MNRLLGIFCLIVAVAVAINFVVTPLYMPLDDTGYVYPIWEYMNWFMAAALLIALYANLRIFKTAKADGDQCCSSACNCCLCGATIVLALAYFHNWFLTMRFNPPDEYELFLWAAIDAVFPLIVGYTGLKLMKTPA